MPNPNNHRGPKKKGSKSSRHSVVVKFGVPLAEAFKDDALPVPLVDMLVYIAQEGVTTTDLFRRPGNPSDLKMIMKRLAEGKEVIFTNYNFYTLASVIKKFLIKIPDGVFGIEVEQKLLGVLEIDNRMAQYEEIHRILSKLPTANQNLLALLFGTWFRIVNHSEFNTMSSEAVAKSVAGSLFHTCASDPKKIEEAVLVLQILIDDFGVANMFGRKNIQYFADVTRTGIRVKEKFKYEYQYPAGDSIPYERALELFALVLQTDAREYGFDVEKDALSEDEFYGKTSRPRANTKDSGDADLPLPSSPSSPKSLQQTYEGVAMEGNPHKKLTHKTSLSAPEVNQGYEGEDSQRMYTSSSYSKFDRVRQRQILRMKKRSNWFLAPDLDASIGSEGMLGSREASVGKSSIDATSSDALMSDMTQSDDTPADPLRLSSDIDSTVSDGEHLNTPSAHQPLHRLAQQRPQHRPHQRDMMNGNHSSNSPHLDSSKEGSPAHPSQLSETEVRYFMVENWYGQPGESGTQKS